MLDQPAHGVAAAADGWQLPAAHDGLATRVTETFSRNAQAQDRTFDARQREQENALLHQRHGDVIHNAMPWAEQTIAPAATLPQAWPPLPVLACAAHASAQRKRAV